MTLHFTSDIVEARPVSAAFSPAMLNEVFRQRRVLCQSEGRMCAADCIRRQLGMCGHDAE